MNTINSQQQHSLNFIGSQQQQQSLNFIDSQQQQQHQQSLNNDNSQKQQQSLSTINSQQQQQQQSLNTSKSQQQQKNCLMEELTKLSKVAPHARHPSEQMYEYCLSSYFYSAKGYRFSLQSFPFPSVSSLYKHFGIEMSKLKEYISDIKYVPFLLESYIEMYEIQKKHAFYHRRRCDCCMWRPYV